MIAVQLDVSLEEALARLRAHAGRGHPCGERVEVPGPVV
jgi:hypothetical protein